MTSYWMVPQIISKLCVSCPFFRLDLKNWAYPKDLLHALSIKLLEVEERNSVLI